MFNLISFVSFFNNITIVEILFSTLAGVGVIFSFLTSIEAVLDYIAIRKLGIGNGRRLLALTFMQNEIGRLIIQTIFLTLGILSLLLPHTHVPQSELPTLVVVFGYMFRWGLTLSSAILMYKSIFGHYARKSLKAERITRTEAGNLSEPLTEPHNIEDPK